MFDSMKNKLQRSALISILQFIATGTQSAAGYAFVPKAEAEKLHKAEPHFVTIDLSVTNKDGLVKVTATKVAIDALSNTASSGNAAAATTTSKEVKEPMNYEIVTLTELPPILRGGHKADSYPFAELNAFPATGNAFFVPATEARPNPAKTLASTVASATKRYKGERVFTVRKVTVDGKVTGAQVIRTE